MGTPFLTVNQFFGNASGPGQKTALGHVNVTFFGADGRNLGTYGANMKGNGYAYAGVHEESASNNARISAGSPFQQLTINMDQAAFDKTFNFAVNAAQRSAAGELGYALNCGNCVDFFGKVLDNAGIGKRHAPDYLLDHTALDIYAQGSNLMCSDNPADKAEMRKVVNTDKDRDAKLPAWAKDCIDAKVVNGNFVESDDAWDVLKKFTINEGSCEKEVIKFITQNLNISSPIVINLDGKGIETVSLFDSTVSFDLTGRGEQHSAWIKPSSGFLVLDRDGNERIDSVHEMFGGAARGEGYAKLALLDDNGDRSIDAGDASYARLQVWRDVNIDGVTDAGELYSLAELGIERLDLNYQVVDLVDEGNLIGEQSVAVILGQQQTMADVYFRYA